MFGSRQSTGRFCERGTWSLVIGPVAEVIINSRDLTSC